MAKIYGFVNPSVHCISMFLAVEDQLLCADTEHALRVGAARHFNERLQLIAVMTGFTDGYLLCTIIK